MTAISYFIIKHKKLLIAIFVVAALLCAVLQMFVKVNYNMVDYLPSDAQSTTALNIMSDEFTQSIPNTQVMVNDVTVAEALDYKEKLAEIEGVTEVIWLDDTVDIKVPLEMGDPEVIEQFYKDNHALFSLTIADGMEKQTIADIQALIGPDNAVAGEAPELAEVQHSTGSEVINSALVLVPAIILILILSTTSWIEPILFLIVIGISILLNMGTNVIFGKISFMTNSVSPILQLAVSLDYAVFLLHSFSANRKKYKTAEKAMFYAIKGSMSTVAASAATTLFGFIALVFMNFRIGADLGINLAKGIVLSFVSVIVFLPALTLSVYKWIDKTQHRPLLPNFKNIHKVVMKAAFPVAIIVMLLIVPAFLGQKNAPFTYGFSDTVTTSRSGQDSMKIQDEFGHSIAMVLLIPEGDVAKEKALCEDLEALTHVTGVVSYASTVGSSIPSGYLDKEITQRFYSGNFARIILYTNTEAEGDVAFETVEEIQGIAKAYYGDDAWSVGQSANLYDMKNIIAVDNQRVTIIAVLAIFVVLLVTFKSAILPILLLLTIESGIWLNLSLPYFTGTSISFIGYLVLSTVQLGATVDYAILLTHHYMQNRKTALPNPAIRQSLGETFQSMLVSAASLSTAGFTLFFTSSNPIISDLGLLLGRGTLISLSMVICFLPALLIIFDKVVGKLTLKADFLQASHANRNEKKQDALPIDALINEEN
ncbi:MAG: MMPL family transporter [Eubacteriales bacterium]